MSAGLLRLVRHGWQDDSYFSNNQSAFIASVNQASEAENTLFCRYMLADDKDTLYVSFMGTKQRRDLVTNAAVLQEPIWSSHNLAADEQKVSFCMNNGFICPMASVVKDGELKAAKYLPFCIAGMSGDIGIF